MKGGLTRCVCVTVQVDLVCHGKTEVFPDKDASDPYAVSTGSNTCRTVLHLYLIYICLYLRLKYAVGTQSTLWNLTIYTSHTVNVALPFVSLQ